MTSIALLTEFFSSTGKVLSELMLLKKKTSGSTRKLVSEIKDNFYYLDLIVKDGVSIDHVIEKLSVSIFKELEAEGFDFDKLKKKRIELPKSLESTNLSSWQGKSTSQLVESIYEKINELIIKYPIVSDHNNYRWSVRIINIHRRIELLLLHVRS